MLFLWGTGEFVGNISFVWLVVVGFVFRYLTPFVSSVLHLIRWHFFLSVEGCKRITEGREKRLRYFLNFNFIVFHMTSL